MRSVRTLLSTRILLRLVGCMSPYYQLFSLRRVGMLVVLRSLSLRSGHEAGLPSPCGVGAFRST